MKNLILFALLLCAGFCPVNSSAMSPVDAPDYIIIDEIVAIVRPVEYMNADYVTIQLLDLYGSVQNSVDVPPGKTVNFPLNSQSRTIVTTFHVGLVDYIIQEDTEH